MQRELSAARDQIASSAPAVVATTEPLDLGGVEGMAASLGDMVLEGQTIMDLAAKM